MWLLVAGIAFCLGGTLGIIYGVNALARWQRRTGKVLR